MPRAVRYALLLLPTLAVAVGLAVVLVQRWDVPPPDLGVGDGRLVVVVVFDQMRGDYPDRWADLCGDGGFKRFARDGVQYAEAYLPYGCSSTGPGHASIGTGVVPAAHGVVENNWFDRPLGKAVYCALPDHEYSRVPPLPERFRGAKEATDRGFGPDRLLATGTGDHLKGSEPGRVRVFSLSLKDRSAALMGGKGPDGVYCFDVVTGQFHTSSYYADRLPPWAAEFNLGDPADRWFGKEWARLRGESNYAAAVGPDDAAGEARFGRLADGGLEGYGPTFPHAMNIDRDPHPGKRYYERVEASPFGNDLLWEFTKACIAGERLGRAGKNDLLYVSFSANDLVGHKWGPDSHEALDVTLRSDALLADVLAHLDAKVGVGRYTVVVTADHGVCPLPEQAVRTHPDAARFEHIPEFDAEAANALLDRAFGANPEPWVVPGRFNLYPHLYLNPKAAAARDADPSAAADLLAKWAANRPHMMAAFPRSALLGPPSGDPLLRSLQLGYHPDRCGDVVVVPKPYCMPGRTIDTGATHGSPHEYDTHVPLMAFGAGVPPLGRRADPASSLAVAPIVCRALDVPPPPNVAPLPPGWE